MTNRERFLTKAKHIKTDEWVEGYYCRISETTYCTIGDVPPVPVHHYILHETMTDWGLPNRFLQYEVNPTTICHIDEEFPEDVSQFKVEWSGNGWVMAQRGCIDKEYISEFETENYEVVGNIFDNSPDRSTNTPTKQLHKELNNGDIT